MRYELPTAAKPSPEKTTTVMYRLPESIQDAFNTALDRSGLSGQGLVDSMVQHCLADSGLLPKKVQEPEYVNPVCKGSHELGSACGTCERCRWRMKRQS